VWFSDYPFEINGIDFVSFKSCKNERLIKGFLKEDFTTHIINTQQELPQIWKNMSKSSCRYAIHKAQKDGVKIRINQDYDQFIEINHNFRKRKGILEQYVSKEYMMKNGVLFLAYLDDEMLGGQFYICDDENIRWLIGASKRLSATHEKAIIIGNANRLLIWEAIKFAKNNGKREFDLGGYYTGTAANQELECINKFKGSFGGTLKKNYNYSKIYSRKYWMAANLFKIYLATKTRMDSLKLSFTDKK